ncbi:MAG TPA: hypothetical protein VLD61_02830 [Methylomirabilota bacterium]|nr:hypothetical protein [Methylomirabilota bacterium]
MRRLVLVLLVAGCGLGRPVPLDLLPGHRAVLARFEVTGFDASPVVLAVVREDGTYGTEVPVSPGGTDVALSLPPGYFRIPRLRVIQDRLSTPNAPVRYLAVGFSVGLEPATYIGTLRIQGRFGEQVQLEVRDDYERTVPALRGRYTDIPEQVERALMRAAS